MKPILPVSQASFSHADTLFSVVLHSLLEKKSANNC